MRPDDSFSDWWRGSSKPILIKSNSLHMNHFKLEFAKYQQFRSSLNAFTFVLNKFEKCPKTYWCKAINRHNADDKVKHQYISFQVSVDSCDPVSHLLNRWRNSKWPTRSRKSRGTSCANMWKKCGTLCVQFLWCLCLEEWSHCDMANFLRTCAHHVGFRRGVASDKMLTLVWPVYITATHYSNFTWPPCSLKSHAYRLFLQQLV